MISYRFSAAPRRWKLRLLLALILAGTLLGWMLIPRPTLRLSRPSSKPWEPQEAYNPFDTSAWRERVDETHGANPARNPELIFIGDSLTENWEFHAKDIWERQFAPRHALNLGIWGDRTENVLWRLDNRPIDRFNPRAVVILIGINNLFRYSPEGVARGVIAVVERVRNQMPSAAIVLMGLFPTSTEEGRWQPAIRETNRLLEAWAADQGVTFLDIGGQFYLPDGSIPEEYLLDGVHLSHEGYRLWAEAMEPTLRQFFDVSEERDEGNSEAQYPRPGHSTGVRGTRD